MSTKNVSQESANEAVAKIVQKGILPEHSEFLCSFHDSNGEFFAQESDMFDYKADYPFSNSDSYFVSILRLICALHNTYGGIIIFGVHDTQRTAGKNKVYIDDEKINRKLRENLTRKLLVSCRKYMTPSGEIDVLLIPKRTITPPIRFSKTISKYQDATVFFRRGAEVLEAGGNEIDFLYGPRTNPYSGDDEENLSIESALPNSPATIARLLGRYEVIEEVFDWLQASRDARFFLWGDGGSGKSTLAFEVGRLLSLIGKSVKNKYRHYYDGVVYLTAKKVFLDPESAKIIRFQGTDFASSLELYKAILLLSEYGDAEVIQTYDEEKCLDELEGLLNAQAQLIIIDDIDTLTSGDIDAGMEQLFSIAARCASGSKLLYTLRKVPSFARKNSMEVPGFREADELPEFLSLCSRQFGVCAPNEEEAKRIFIESEARPLAIETIVGLRRITADYTDAIKRWKSDKSDALDYLFRKEYDALSDPRSKLLLAALVNFETAQIQETLQSILVCSSDQMQDAISEVREMFLRIGEDEETGSTKYSLRSATRAFLVSASKDQDRYIEIKARVENFNFQAQSTSPALLTLIARARRNRENGDAKLAWNLLTNISLPKGATEHPKFKAELGITASSLSPPNLTEARRCFEDAFLFGHRHHEMYQIWLRMEKQADSGTTRGIEVCEKVLMTSEFNLRTKASFRRQLAYLQAMKSKNLQLSSPEESSQLRRACILNNVLAFKEAQSSNVPDVNSYRAQAAESINKLSSGCGRWFPHSEFGIFVEKLVLQNVPLAPLSSEIVNSFRGLLRTATENERRITENTIRRISGKIKNKNSGNFSDESERAEFVDNLNRVI